MPKPTPAVERFWSKIEKTEACWKWTAGIDGKGYGILWINGRTTKAYRFAYELLVGPIPSDKVIDHICGVRVCVNPDHLRLVTLAQNNQNRKANSGTRTGIRGVSINRGQYRVQATINGVWHFGGRFTDLADAERAAIALRNKLMTHNDSDRG
jgi:hypothetical protein